MKSTKKNHNKKVNAQSSEQDKQIPEFSKGEIQLVIDSLKKRKGS